ncbi:Aldehyde/histidinol dehydrogenase [Aspergillus affinis]|uniref:Aldehyde/histidinol dehydrogenase n=1 Tax=Aspergillus affinis TaxID=1070780 RepID=UPI0022FDBA06|nr:Aldehyde/histidinol dehydrogenase [Aspergillus affinis]KAI9036083.1 Aldehyde/histidinol dehydrogenase [Aspergillus affinis]
MSGWCSGWHTQQATLLSLESRFGPYVTPAPFRDEFLARASKITGPVGQRSIHVRISHDCSADLETLLKKNLVKGPELDVISHDKFYTFTTMSSLPFTLNNTSLFRTQTYRHGEWIEAKSKERFDVEDILLFINNYRPENHCLNPKGRLITRLDLPGGLPVKLNAFGENKFFGSIILRKVGAALAAGCTMIAKPSPETLLTTLALGYLAEQAGFDKGVFNVVTTSNKNTPSLSEALRKHELVHKVSFTGSTRVGSIIAGHCAVSLKKVTIELGGLFKTEDEVVKLANDTEMGLASYVFTKSIDRCWRMMDRLEAGMVGVNTGNSSAAESPFGGMKMSGNGKESGKNVAVAEYLVSKTCTLTLER